MTTEYFSYANCIDILCCRVKLAVNRENLEAVAVKIIDLSRHPSVEKNIRKEVSGFLSIMYNRHFIF